MHAHVTHRVPARPRPAAALHPPAAPDFAAAPAQAARSVPQPNRPFPRPPIGRAPRFAPRTLTSNPKHAAPASPSPNFDCESPAAACRSPKVLVCMRWRRPAAAARVHSPRRRGASHVAAPQVCAPTDLTPSDPPPSPPPLCAPCQARPFILRRLFTSQLPDPPPSPPPCTHATLAQTNNAHANQGSSLLLLK